MDQIPTTCRTDQLTLRLHGYSQRTSLQVNTNPTRRITAGITQIKDICYEAIPGLLPIEAK